MRTSRPLSCSSCFKRIAALSPAGPPPTMQTSTSSLARSTLFGSKSSRRRSGVECRERVRYRVDIGRGLQRRIMSWESAGKENKEEGSLERGSNLSG